MNYLFNSSFFIFNFIIQSYTAVHLKLINDSNQEVQNSNLMFAIKLRNITRCLFKETAEIIGIFKS